MKVNLVLEGQKTNILSITHKGTHTSALGLGEENIDNILIRCDVDKVAVEVLYSDQKDEWYERKRIREGWTGDSIYGDIKWNKTEDSFLYKLFIPENNSPYILFKDETLPKISNAKIDIKEGTIPEFSLKGFAI